RAQAGQHNADQESGEGLLSDQADYLPDSLAELRPPRLHKTNHNIRQCQKVNDTQRMKIGLFLGVEQEIAQIIQLRPSLQNCPEGQRHGRDDEDRAYKHESRLSKAWYRQPLHFNKEADEEDGLPREG